MVRKFSVVILLVFISLLLTSVFFKNKDLELNYVGLEKLNASEVDKLTKNVKFSFFSDNVKEITNAIKQNLLVEFVSTRKCSFFSLKCYVVEISEAIPSFLIHESDTNKDYYFSVSGKQMYSSLNEKESESLNSYYKKTEFIKYVTEEKLTSFYLYDANINYILYSLNLFNKSKIKILKVELVGKKLQKVFVEGLEFPVIFSFNSNEKELLEKELNRLKVILKDLNGNYSDIMAINLAYGRVGSVIYSNNIKYPIK